MDNYLASQTKCLLLPTYIKPKDIDNHPNFVYLNNNEYKKMTFWDIPNPKIRNYLVEKLQTGKKFTSLHICKTFIYHKELSQT